ncbi:serine hydrolase [Sabulibacter ruber]|uniref:serine hydrolase n=1 Tax=Sabulibacter ruber TaxID=2811901 RepID=UPI001A95F926
MALFLFLIFSCQDEDPTPPQYLLEEGLTSFSFLKEDNSSLTEDVNAVISGTRIKLNLPPGVTKGSLVASFSTKSKGTKVFIGELEQTSRTNVNDFSSDIIYKAVSEDGKRYSYHVEINPVTEAIDEALEALRQRYKVPGMSVAITRNGKIVFSKGYGYADKTTGDLVNNQSMFRVASLSKPVTHAAILKLVQDGKLSLSDKVFGAGGILGGTYPSPPAKSAIGQITVRNLIDHTAGWANNPNDPMFGDYSFTAEKIIENQILHRPLDYKPGTTFFYSNIGYCILGRVIEKVTGKKYSDFVKEEILMPAGVSGMRIAGSTHRQRAKDEVVYYQNEFDPYSYNMARMDSHGGWIATAEDLAHFMAVIDRNPGEPDLIDSGLLRTGYFGYTNWTHYGSMAGTTSVITRLNDEYSFVVLANTRVNDSPHQLADDINVTLSSIIVSGQILTIQELSANSVN